MDSAPSPDSSGLPGIAGRATLRPFRREGRRSACRHESHAGRFAQWENRVYVCRITSGEMWRPSWLICDCLR